MMKYLVIFVVFMVAVEAEDLESKIKRLAETDGEGLEKLISKRDTNGDHFCCKKKPIDIIRVSQAVAREKVVKDKIKVGREGCGFLGIAKCDIYDYEYKKVTYYDTEYKTVPKRGDCPPQNITCCNGYFYIKGLQRCVLLKDLGEVIKVIEKAKKLQEEQGGNS